jgi:EmrB/QacA subfamily drug resistance transporter
LSLTLRERIRNKPTYKWWALGVLVLGFFSTGISITILSAVLPTIARQFRVGPATIAWVVTGPMLVYGVLMPTMGKLGDLYGRKRVYLLGWGVAAVFAGLAALSWSAGALIAFRFLGAAAGSATGPLALALILAAFGPSERVTALGWWSFAGAGAPVLGLVIGGPLVDLVGWRWIFAVQPPLTAPAIVVAWIVLRDDAPHTRPVFDVVGSVTLGLGMAALLYGMNRAGAAGWTRPEVMAPLALAPLLFVVFVLVERRHPEPLIPLGYFRRRNVAFPMGVQLVSHIPYMGSFFLSPFLFHAVLHYDNTRTALAVLPRPLANSMLSFAAGYASVKLGERFTAVAGMATLAAGTLLLSFVGAGSSFAMIACSMALTGAGLGLAFPGLVSSVANAVSESHFGSMSAAQNMAQTVGMVAGMQGLQTIQALRAGAVGQVRAYHEAFWVGTGVSVVALAMAAAIHSMHRAAAAPPVESPEAPYVPEPVGRER